MSRITVGIPTKNRYDSLSHTLLSIALQSVPPYEVIIVDDSDEPVDLRTIPAYSYIFRLFDDKKVKWRVLFGQKKGQHHSHQLIQEIAETELIFRIDDDEVAQFNVLARLGSFFKEDIGAIAPAVTMPNPEMLPKGLTNSINDLTKPNMQWFVGGGWHEVDHLYSCFLYRKGIAKYDLNLSTVAHREETIFSHSIKRAGYTLGVDFGSHVWHFRSDTGGIRSFHDTALWEHDEKIFQGYLHLWNVVSTERKIIVLDNGLGDHYCFKNILPSLRKKYENITIACCFPGVFFDEEGLDLISIAEAKLMFGNIDAYGVYKFMQDNNWKQSLLEAFKQLYL